MQLGTRIVTKKADSENYCMGISNILKHHHLIPNKPGYGLIYSDGQTISNPTPFVSPDMSNIDNPNVITRLGNNYNSSKYNDESDYWQL